MIPGGRYERQAGAHFNPYTYDDIKTIADHRHYVGANPHAAVGKSGDLGGGHAHCGALIYQGGAWPEEYAGSLFMNNIHGARLNRDLLEPEGSGFVGSHAPDFLFANDSWSQIISLKTGPDGQVYFIDWYDRQQCHQSAQHPRPDQRPDLQAELRPAQAGHGRPRQATDRGADDPDQRPERLVRRARHSASSPSARPTPHRQGAPRPGFCADRTEPFRLRYLWASHAARGRSTPRPRPPGSTTPTPPSGAGRSAS